MTDTFGERLRGLGGSAKTHNTATFASSRSNGGVTDHFNNLSLGVSSSAGFQKNPFLSAGAAAGGHATVPFVERSMAAGRRVKNELLKLNPEQVIGKAEFERYLDDWFPADVFTEFDDARLRPGIIGLDTRSRGALLRAMWKKHGGRVDAKYDREQLISTDDDYGMEDFERNDEEYADPRKMLDREQQYVDGGMANGKFSTKVRNAFSRRPAARSAQPKETVNDYDRPERPSHGIGMATTQAVNASRARKSSESRFQNPFDQRAKLTHSGSKSSNSHNARHSTRSFADEE